MCSRPMARSIPVRPLPRFVFAPESWLLPYLALLFPHIAFVRARLPFVLVHYTELLPHLTFVCAHQSQLFPHIAFVSPNLDFLR
jgi:hypothetical protein